MRVEGPKPIVKPEGTYRVPARKILPAVGSAIRDLLVQMGVFRAPKNKGAVALGAALGEVAQRMSAPSLLDRVPTSRTLTHRERELPYRIPPDMKIGTAKTPVDLAALDPTKTYLWVLDAEGRFLVAPELQDGVEGKVNHGDMCPAEGGTARGAARAGGELKAVSTPEGTRWAMDLSSSFSFNRMDLDVLGDPQLEAVLGYLKSTGMDTSTLEPARNTFDAIYRFAGFLHLAKYYVGVGAPR